MSYMKYNFEIIRICMGKRSCKLFNGVLVSQTNFECSEIFKIAKRNGCGCDMMPLFLWFHFSDSKLNTNLL